MASSDLHRQAFSFGHNYTIMSSVYKYHARFNPQRAKAGRDGSKAVFGPETSASRFNPRDFLRDSSLGAI
jgi:hypothetical protein